MKSLLSKIGFGQTKHVRGMPPPPSGFKFFDANIFEHTDVKFDRHLLSGSAEISYVKGSEGSEVGPIYEITVGPDSAIVLVVNDPYFEVGTKASGSFLVWKENGTSEIRSRISRFGGNSENEQTVITQNVSDSVVSVKMEHQFTHKHPGARLQIDTRGERASFFIAKPKLILDNPGI